jgi:hypothetical protein
VGGAGFGGGEENRLRGGTYLASVLEWFGRFCWHVAK